ncbi:hypothetical protein [Brachyspira alvinipulli]|uniref:hypothetical protein n=1 Tax=Brachyspira alvinipulli TaxID=84379 RepID=UPI000482FA45|nr:hypothetical protein [Brachyspira alvinipulli]
MNKLIKNKKSIYILFAFVSIIIFYLSINILYTQTSNNLPSAEKFVNNIDITVSTTNDSEILIEWDGINNSNLIYYVYRSESPIIGKYSLVNSKVVDYVKATNTSRKYAVVDRPVLSSNYYYAVVSYIDNVSFYNSKPKVDTLSIIFNGVVNTNNNQYKIDNTTNNSQYKIDDAITNNQYKIDNTNTIIYEYTNVLVTTNVYNITNTYIITTTNVVNNTSGVIKSSNTYNNNSSLVSKYKNEYDRAVIQFKAGNYLSAASILEPVSKVNVSRTLYYNINLLLGKCYKNLRRKKNALDVFNRIKTYNAQEVNFWINQVLTDL